MLLSKGGQFLEMKIGIVSLLSFAVSTCTNVNPAPAHLNYSVKEINILENVNMEKTTLPITSSKKSSVSNVASSFMVKRWANFFCEQC